MITATKLEVNQYETKDHSNLLSTVKLTEPKLRKWGFHFKKCEKNPDYEKGIRYLHAFDPCLIGSNDAKRKPKIWPVKTAPKWLTTLGYYNVNPQTGEIVGAGEYETNEFKKSNAKKIKAMDAFCGRYNDLYQNRRISIMFHTFTRPNMAKIDFRRMLDDLKKRYRSLGFQVLGYIWTAEVTDENSSNGQGLMWHYHVAVALNKRLNIKGKAMPDELKVEDLWGQRTDVQFVKKNIRHYMAKYFAKHNARVMGTRSYGRTRKFL